MSIPKLHLYLYLHKISQLKIQISNNALLMWYKRSGQRFKRDINYYTIHKTSKNLAICSKINLKEQKQRKNPTG